VTDFQLHPRLRADCMVLGELGPCLLLLLNDARLPWFILVPRCEPAELDQLPASFRTEVLAKVQQLSACIRENFEVTRLNIASIGNMVPQLHLHVIGRSPADPFWPGVVWGQGGAIPYEPEAAASLRIRLQDALGAANLKPSKLSFVAGASEG